MQNVSRSRGVLNVAQCYVLELVSKLVGIVSLKWTFKCSVIVGV